MVETWEVANVCGWVLQLPDEIRTGVGLEAGLGIRIRVNANGVPLGVR